MNKTILYFILILFLSNSLLAQVVIDPKRIKDPTTTVAPSAGMSSLKFTSNIPAVLYLDGNKEGFLSPDGEPLLVKLSTGPHTIKAVSIANSSLFKVYHYTNKDNTGVKPFQIELTARTPVKNTTVSVPKVDLPKIDMVQVGSFFIGKYEVTQKLWVDVMKSNPSKFSSNPELPVDNISWVDCHDFLKKLDSITHKKYRLPTEKEWVLAAKENNPNSTFSFSGSDDIDDVAWYGSNSNKQTHPVGQKKPNKLKIYDMTGNVWEWCEDKITKGVSKKNPFGFVAVVRGGGWSNSSNQCKIEERKLVIPDHRDNRPGLRLCISE